MDRRRRGEREVPELLTTFNLVVVAIMATIMAKVTGYSDAGVWLFILGTGIMAIDIIINRARNTTKEIKNK